jgi:DNA mismatch repair protein MutL
LRTSGTDNSQPDEHESSFISVKSSIMVQGYAALPALDHANRNKIILFVNGRPVQDARLSYAVVQAYHTLLMVGRYPVAVIMLQAPPEDVDVNVHPAKAEVRFRDTDAVFSAVQRAVRRALLENLPVPEPPSVFVDRRADMAGGTAPADTSDGLPIEHPMPTQHAPVPLSGAERWDQVGIARNSAPETPNPTTPDRPVQTSQFPPRPMPQLPALRILGQLAASYIIAEGPEGLYLIDQHAAHERIMFERMMAARELGAAASQALLDPAPVDVSADRG